MNRGTYIEKIDIQSFGKLKNISITPSKGLNILTAPNEAGKSTVASFIKYIFYGFSGVRKQTISENEKLLYTPWGKTSVSGGITIVTPEGKFRIERSQSTNQETLTVYDVNTGKPAHTGAVPGEVFFGIGEESFQKILFFKQLYLPKNGDEALAEQIQNLIFSADEKTNAEKAEKRIKDARSTLKNNQKRGLIPNLENLLEDYDAKLTKSLEVKRDLDTVLQSLNEKKQKIDFNGEKLSLLEKEAKNINKFEAKKRLDGLIDLAKRKEEAEKKYKECLASFEGGNPPESSFVQELIDDNARFSMLEKKLDETSKDIKDETKRHEMERESTPFFETSPEKITGRLKTRRAFSLLLFLTSIGVAAFAGYRAYMLNIDGIFYALAGGFALTFIISIVLASKTPTFIKDLGFENKTELIKAINDFPVVKMRVEEMAKRIKSLEKAYAEDSEKYGNLKKSIDSRIKKYTAEEDITYGIAIQKLLNLSLEAGSLKAECMTLEERLDLALKEVNIEDLKQKAEGAALPLREAGAVQREIEFYKSANEGLKVQEMELERQKASLEAKSPSPSVLYGKREAVKAKLDEYNLKYAAFEIALEVLEEAGDYMKSTISPKLAQLSSAYFTAVTQGRYPSMLLTTDLTMSVATPEGDKSADYLSGGAKDTAYLCLRYALVDLLYDREKPFILLDDAFSRIDDDRLKLMLKSLVSLSEDQQIMIFTCHNREGEFLKEITKKAKTLEI